MQEESLRQTSRALDNEFSDYETAGRTRDRRAEQERPQGPASPCAPESARPAFSSSVTPRPKPKETLTQKGAIALAKRLERYWHDRGYPAARFWAEPIEERFDKVGSYEIYRVVSNLVNGWPPRYVEDPTS